MSVQDLIAPVSDKLTPTERRIAGVVLHDPTVLAFGTVSELAERAETSKPSIVRFAAKLGFDGFTDLQKWIRDELTQQLASPSQRIRHRDESGTAARDSITDSVNHTIAMLNKDRLIALAKPIADANRVWIISGETSMAGAVVLHSGLSMIRPDVSLVDDHSTGRELCSAEPSDAAVVFDFARYRRNSITAAQKLDDLGVPIVAITDSPLSPLASIARAWCELDIPAVGPFDSSIPAVLTAELLVSQVVDLLGDRARDQIDRLESFWQTTGVFLSYTPRSNRKP